jgi:hypothetical protein
MDKREDYSEGSLDFMEGIFRGDCTKEEILEVIKREFARGNVKTTKFKTFYL